MDNDQIWYLQKHDDQTVFGPVNVDNLRDWAMAAKISPLDRVSCDHEKTWDRAPMIPSLHMDWLVEVSDNYLYGPTTIGTVQEFIANGEIDESTKVINCKDGKRYVIGDNPVFKNAPKKAPVILRPDLMNSLDVFSENLSPIELQKRLLELEALILQQQRTIENWKRRHQALQEKYDALAGDGGY